MSITCFKVINNRLQLLRCSFNSFYNGIECCCQPSLVSIQNVFYVFLACREQNLNFSCETSFPRRSNLTTDECDLLSVEKSRKCNFPVVDEINSRTVDSFSKVYEISPIHVLNCWRFYFLRKMMCNTLW